MEGGKANYLWLVLGFCLLMYVGNTQHIPGAPYDNEGIPKPEVQQQTDNAGCKLEDGVQLCPAVFEVGE